MKKAYIYGIVAVIIAIVVGVGIYYYYYAPAPSAPEEVVFNWCSSIELRYVDPSWSRDATSLMACANLYDSLFMFDNWEPVPSLVTSYTVSPDGLNYTFKIRDDVTFQDGSALTAEDVKFSMVRHMVIGQSSTAPTWSSVLDPENITVTASDTVEMMLSKPFPPLIATLVNAFVLNEDVVMDNLVMTGDTAIYGDLGDYGEGYLYDHAAGSGPYMLESLDRISQMVLVKFDDYWRGWTSNQIDKVIVKVIKEHATIKLALQSKEIDMTDAFMTTEEITDLEKTTGIIGETGASLEMTCMFFHNQREPLNNTHVRRAISYAINYDDLQLLFPSGTPTAASCVASLAEGYVDAGAYEYNVTKANEELALSGYLPEDIRPLTLEVSSGDPRWQSIAQLVKQNLDDIGITVNIEQVTVPTMYGQAYDMDETPDMVGFYFTETWPDAWAYLRHYRSDAARTLRTEMWVNDTWLDSKLDEASVQTDNTERLEIMGQIQEYIMNNAINCFINDYPNQLAHWDYVKGFQWGGHQRNFWFYGLTIEK